MVYSSINGQKWKQQTMKKLLGFCDKCPVMFSIQTCLNNGKDGVFIIHENTGQKYFFEWDYSKQPKDFVHDIKMFLVEKHYPLLIETTYEVHELSKEELAKKVESGTPINKLFKAEKREVYKLWQIDKVIALKDIFILQELDPNTRKPIGPFVRYKMNSPAILFMNDYRNGEFKTLKDAGNEFFSQSMMIDVLK